MKKCFLFMIGISMPMCVMSQSKGGGGQMRE